MSKGGGSNRPSNALFYQSVQERPQKEETEVDDDDDYIKDPNFDDPITSTSNQPKNSYTDNNNPSQDNKRRQSITKR